MPRCIEDPKTVRNVSQIRSSRKLVLGGHRLQKVQPLACDEEEGCSSPKYHDNIQL